LLHLVQIATYLHRHLVSTHVVLPIVLRDLVLVCQAHLLLKLLFVLAGRALVGRNERRILRIRRGSGLLGSLS
jgi:hypothetical protein